jgi:uncharacterized protein
MELTNEFKVDVPVDKAFEVLTDVERIAPCMPGAQLQEIEGDEYRGIVKVKVGPITAQYKGAARFVERDEAAHRAVLRAEGRDTRGQGNANATITASLVPEGDGTKVTVATDLTVTGRVAQFGRGVMADVSTKLLGQFVDCLEHQVLGGSSTEGAAEETAPAESAVEPLTESVTAVADDVGERPEPPAESAVAAREAPPVRKIESPEAEPIDLLDSAGAPVAKRAVPVVLGVVAFVWLVRLFVKRRRRKG